MISYEVRNSCDHEYTRHQSHRRMFLQHRLSASVQSMPSLDLVFRTLCVCGGGGIDNSKISYNSLVADNRDYILKKYHLY